LALETATRTVVVVIVSFNVRSLLSKCLTTVLQSEGISVEVSVVDNASADESAAMVASDFPSVRLIANTVNRGFGAACNQAILGAEAEYVLILNPDTVVSADAIRVLADYLDQHPVLGVVGPRIFLSDGADDVAARRSFPSPGVALFRLTHLDKLFPRHGLARYNRTDLAPDIPQEVDCGSGACMLFRRLALDQVGMFDEAFFMYGEDIDLCYRLSQAGWKMGYVPAASIVHYRGQSSSQSSSRMIKEFHRSMLIFFRKHYSHRTVMPLRLFVNAGLHMRCWTLLVLVAIDRRFRTGLSGSWSVGRRRYRPTP
jgi:GT2 family glycosyltransferase